MSTGILNGNIEHLPEFDRHESVIFVHDADAGLTGFIVVHNTTLGSATGGTRLQKYPSEAAALSDALRLSKAMSYKCALANVPFGGGKGVLMASRGMRRNPVLRSYARKIDALGGLFRTGTDVGITDRDVSVMAKETKYMDVLQEAGLKPYHTADMAALGVYLGIRAGFKEKFGTRRITGKTVAVKGVGKLGAELVRLLINDGVRVLVADIDHAKITRIQRKFPEVIVSDPKTIHAQESDAFAPCALAGDLNPLSIKQLKAAIVAGGANNQLASPEAGDLLFKQGILYAPDYVINAGGLINVCAKSEKSGYKKKQVIRRVEKIQDMLSEIFIMSRKQHMPSHRIADLLAERKIYAK